MNLLSLFQRYWSVIGHRLGWILLAGLPLAIALGLNAFYFPMTYTARAVFHPDAGNTKGMLGESVSPLALILGGGTEGQQQGQMIEILNSRHVNEAVAADSITVDGVHRRVAHVFLEMYDPGFSLQVWLIELFTGKPEPPTEAQLIRNAATILMELIKAETSENGFIVMQFSCKSAAVARQVSYHYIKHLSDYFKRQKTQKAQANVDFFTQRADSVKRELDKVNYGLARNIDQNQFRIRATSEVYPAELRAKQEILKQMFITLTINREQALAQLQQDTPVIHVLDPPEPPYSKKGRSILKFGLLGWFTGSFLLTLFLTRKLWIEDLSQALFSALSGQPASTQTPSEP